MENRDEKARWPQEFVRIAEIETVSEGGPQEAVVSENSRAANTFWASVASALAVAVIMMFSGGLESLAKGFMRFLEPAGTGRTLTEEEVAASLRANSDLYSLAGLDIHPDLLFRPYVAGRIVSSDVSSATGTMIRQFRALLDLYEVRQGHDDNFTVRVIDNRTGETLELYGLDEERRAYENRESGTAWNWGRVDRKRRAATNRLVDKYADRGIPVGAITVKWGRRNQVLKARERDLPFIEYEIRLARFLGLSLLATEIGTVETFNIDQLVSPVGARGRYQMMPYTLRQNDIHHYSISTAAGDPIDVNEEWHPLLTMEAAFVTAAGYKNAVGHEIPGISAYHTGPGNIFTVYRMFLTADEALFSYKSTVMDAYVWALTTGFDQVSTNSSFRHYSRGYVASLYGSLRATQTLPIDSTLTLETLRVELKPGKSIFLSDLLRTLSRHDQDLDWGPGTDDLSLYDKFRTLNEHFDLPPAPLDIGGVPPAADVRLVAESHGNPVRFFLPIGAPTILIDAGLDVLDAGKTFRYDHESFGRPDPSQVTIWDRQYESLVHDVMRFEFTMEHRQRLEFLVERFEELAEERPSHYRQTQLKVIRTHQRIWRSSVFEKLASAVRAARGSVRFEPRPPSVLPGPSIVD